jgi:hypothetical protein
MKKGSIFCSCLSLIYIDYSKKENIETNETYDNKLKVNYGFAG